MSINTRKSNKPFQRGVHFFCRVTAGRKRSHWASLSPTIPAFKRVARVTFIFFFDERAAQRTRRNGVTRKTGRSWPTEKSGGAGNGRTKLQTDKSFISVHDPFVCRDVSFNEFCFLQYAKKWELDNELYRESTESDKALLTNTFATCLNILKTNGNKFAACTIQRTLRPTSRVGGVGKGYKIADWNATR